MCAAAFERMVHGTWGRHYTGQISTDWDLYHRGIAGYLLLQWVQRYPIGYHFPIRFLKDDSRVHYIVP